MFTMAKVLIIIESAKQFWLFVDVTKNEYFGFAEGTFTRQIKEKMSFSLICARLSVPLSPDNNKY